MRKRQPDKLVRRKWLKDDTEYCDNSYQDEFYNTDKYDINSTDSEHRELTTLTQRRKETTLKAHEQFIEEKNTNMQNDKIKEITKVYQYIMQSCRKKMRKTVKLLNEANITIWLCINWCKVTF